MTNGNEAHILVSRLSDLWKNVLSNPPPPSVTDLWKEHLQIRNELDTLQSTNSIRWSKTKERMECVSDFLKWCKNMGIEYHSLEIKSSQNGLSLITTEPINADTIAVTVPHSALLSLDQAEHIDSLKKILDDDALLRGMENVSLAMIIAHEVLRGSDSQWAPYFDILPSTFQTPIFYTEQQFLALKPSPVFEEALSLFRAVARHYVYLYLRILGDLIGEKGETCLSDAKKIRPFLGSPFTLHNFSFDFYRWCVSVVSTRINILPSQSKRREDGIPKMIPALIPFIDLANHAHRCTGPASVFSSAESNNVILQINKAIEPGKQLFIYYGPRTNSKFLLHNGFIPFMPNPDDLYELKIGLPMSSANSSIKMKRLEEKNIVPCIQQLHTTVYLFLLVPEPSVSVLKTSVLWDFAVIFVATTIDELENDEKLNTVENKRKACKFLVDRFKLLIYGYNMNNEKLNDNGNDIESTIQRLKAAEYQLLSDYLKCFEQFDI